LRQRRRRDEQQQRNDRRYGKPKLAGRQW